MSRPKPTVILSHLDSHTLKSEQVLVADAIYAVFYDGKPVNHRVVHTLMNYPLPKYKKISHSNSGHAFNSAERLNKLFKTDKFAVYKLTQGEMVTERE